MIAAPAHPAPARHARKLAPLWFGLWGAAAAWGLQELAGYALLSHACYPSWQPSPLPAVSSTWTAVLGTSLAMLLVASAADLTAYLSWRRTRREQRSEPEPRLEISEGRACFMAVSGVIVSSIFLLNIVMNTIVLFLVPPCG